MEALRRVHRGAFAAPSISSLLGRLTDGRERALLTDLVYGTLRHEILLDACLAPLLRNPERLPADVRNALRAGSYELLVRKTAPHAAVAEWVEVVKSLSTRLSGLANAVLRRARIPEELPPHLRCSLPQWLYLRFRELLGDEADAAGLGMLEPEPLWLTAFPGDGRNDPAQVLAAQGCEVRPGPLPGTLAVRPSRPLGELEAFTGGLVQPQNPASLLPAIALGAKEGERVLDLASGNGIKAAQLAAAGALVEAFEVDPRKVERARSNLRRLGLEVEHHVADLRQPPGAEAAPKVLLDAPCSGTGTLRGNPEIKLRLDGAAVAELARLQSDLLDTAAKLTEPGGRLVYSVCALTPEEGPDQVERFLRRHPEFRPEALALPLPLRSAGAGGVVPPIGGLDGFFVASLRMERA